jgi:hypothetical protein
VRLCGRCYLGHRIRDHPYAAVCSDRVACLRRAAVLRGQHTQCAIRARVLRSSGAGARPRPETQGCPSFAAAEGEQLAAGACPLIPGAQAHGPASAGLREKAGTICARRRSYRARRARRRDLPQPQDCAAARYDMTGPGRQGTARWRARQASARGRRARAAVFGAAAGTRLGTGFWQTVSRGIRSEPWTLPTAGWRLARNVTHGPCAQPSLCPPWRHCHFYDRTQLKKR